MLNVEQKYTNVSSEINSSCHSMSSVLAVVVSLFEIPLWRKTLMTNTIERKPVETKRKVLGKVSTVQKFVGSGTLRKGAVKILASPKSA